MDSSHNDSSSDEEGIDSNNRRHHSNHQVQRLEAFFHECPHPDDSQRRQLGNELNLKHKQIKFWFQNRRTQARIHNEKADNIALRVENMKIRCVNEAMEKALETVLCPPCGGPHGKEEQLCNLQKLRTKNVILKTEYERLSSYLTKHGGYSIPSVDALPDLHGPSTYGSTSNNRPASYGSSSNHLPQQSSLLRRPFTRELINTTPLPKPVLLQHFQQLSQLEKNRMFEIAKNAVAEVMSLIQMEHSMWIKSTIDGRAIIDPGNYKRYFTKNSHLKSRSALQSHHESSMEVVVVQMDARNLVDMFLNTEKWARLFPTIVTEAKTIHVLDSMDHPRQTFSRVVYEQLHILSPLVLPREFIILRTCQQMKEDLWLIADVSCYLQNVEFESTAPICTKRPSGVLIQALPHGRSKVTWIEHVEVTDKVWPHQLYRDLLYGGFGYGARRWTATLQRMCERLSLYSMTDFPPTDYPGVVKTIEGRRSVMSLGERMLKNFAWIMKMSDKLDLPQQSGANNSGVRISVRTNTEAGQPPGLIVCAGSSLSLPLPPLQVYDFLRNLEVRHQWDVHCQGNPVTEAARFVTGPDQKNNVTFLQPSSVGEYKLMILQDGFIDALGGMVVYAPMNLNTAYSAISGQVDPSTIPILPSGFIISRDSHPSSSEVDGGSMTLLTLAFQIFVTGPSYYTDLNLKDSATTVNTLVSSAVQRIKAMLNCE
ncbi:Similar to gb/Z54356 HD-ZIP protein (Athb-10) from Arabidopsis thaliana and contains a PF/00046 homeobox domain [Arabidopsis thaliana]|uniref:Homeobox-leucine zipper protein HDG10 n=1 Tax=Arabidopsis thaliana TaxID=3702 RepID=HDG10_ARATH|nr:homeodomain GLABROUS 10 [Arabidopsis thaliana]Q9S9Z0.1 RecName: Full=Homeobox-leucine zipper protein HDG10; AltName: Full=HD-ZIP protein HDG10; AltName: Full=Homeodomain GLABRA 2-like protein 10; AltName: Full=Homeodomain transcription factor HDG10; AltName: Full=Protein HOMEODOMAIN GLABROUS 10 [Arabidopsis thaliana]AAD46012.1 Similar to gb/Z54356 HD-ZIP protein (Athb-10) from Arabidopsis thaliana and contains a PF/00046 homeobox domain [Arabidopsis thaliana]AEE31732.1 homeodomain GLABROUS 10|eukprot:NP_174724.1 homeodomain GLABROUS 10 [Arabidopsis thaliana]